MHILRALILLASFQISFDSQSQGTCTTPIFRNYYGGEANKDDEAIDIRYCTGGGMIVSGRSTSYSAGQYDGLLMKLSDNGAHQWTKIIGSAGDDKLTRVRQTTDGGFIALGESRLNSGSLETWLVKTDASGNISWVKKYQNNVSDKCNPKDIIQLNDGGYSLAINLNESTVNSNGVVLRLNSLGDILWSRVFDNVNENGINNIAEYKDTILVAGFATGDKRDAILTWLSKHDGSFIKAIRIMNQSEFNEEVLSAEASDTGISYNVIVYSSAYVYNDAIFNHYKARLDGTIIYHATTQLGTGSGYRLESWQARSTSDGGYITLVNDSTNRGYGECIKMGPYGKLEWGRSFSENAYRSRTPGMDIASSFGYVFAGYYSAYFLTGNRNKIQVYKTDRIGKIGLCNIDLALDHGDTAINTISAFTWPSISSNNMIATAYNLTVSSQQFTVINTCSTYSCEPSNPYPDDCNVTFLSDYRSDLRMSTSDVTKLNDGTHAMAGSYSYYWNLEPLVIKTKPNGTIQWAKTFNSFSRDARFLKILPTNGNTMLLMGTESYTVNHHVTDSTILLKIDYDGNVIWAKRYGRFSGIEFSDIQPTEDGGIIASIDQNYGSGSSQYTHVVRLDSNGDIIWKKEVQALNTILRNVLYDTNSVYIYANAYIDYTTPSVTIIKLDAATGDYVWHKYYRNTLSKTMRPLTLEKIGDTILAGVNIYTPVSMFQNKREAGFMKINPADGSSYGAYKINNIDHHAEGYNGPFQDNWTARAGNEIVFASSAAIANDTSFYITKMRSDGSISTSKKYSTINNHVIHALRTTSDGLAITGTVKEKNLEWNVGGGRPFLLRTDLDGQIALSNAQCSSITFNATSDTFSVIQLATNLSVVPMPEGPFWGNFMYRLYQPIIRDITTSSTIHCSTASNCTSVHLVGNSIICDTTTTYEYTLVKNAGCVSGSEWQVDTSSVNIMSVTDTSIIVRFKRQGKTIIRGFITSGCAGLSSQMEITIPRKANEISLGADTSLCSGNTYTINVGTGMTNYLWNPAIGTDSIIVITQPGTYELTVTDACNNVFSDMVNITVASFPLSAGSDSSVCMGDSIALTPSTGFINYNWITGYNIQTHSNGTAQVFPYVDTFYVIEAEKWVGCFVRDTINIVVYSSPVINLGADTSVCPGTLIMLDAGGGFASYLWTTATTERFYEADEGLYGVVATTNHGCQAADSIFVSLLPKPIVQLDQRNDLCMGDSRQLNAGNHTSYQWQDGSTGSTFTVTNEGVYSVEVTNSFGCRDTSTTTINLIRPLPHSFLPDDTTICSYGTLQLQPTSSFNHYNWNTGSFQDKIEISQPGTYTLTVRDSYGCVGSDSIIVLPKQCLTGIHMPSGFTPNNDQLNDLFKPYVGGVLLNYRLAIYNRFGQIIFSTNDASKGWNGTLNGVPQEAGAYVFHCRFQFQGETLQEMKGTLVLLR